MRQLHINKPVNPCALVSQYGKQLRDNYRAFKNKQCDQAGGDPMKERYSTYNASNVSPPVRSIGRDFARNDRAETLSKTEQRPRGGRPLLRAAGYRSSGGYASVASPRVRARRARNRSRFDTRVSRAKPAITLAVCSDELPFRRINI